MPIEEMEPIVPTPDHDTSSLGQRAIELFRRIQEDEDLTTKLMITGAAIATFAAVVVSEAVGIKSPYIS